MAPRTSKPSGGGMSRPETPGKGAKASNRSGVAQGERARGSASATKRSSSSVEKKPSSRGR